MREAPRLISGGAAFCGGIPRAGSAPGDNHLSLIRIDDAIEETAQVLVLFDLKNRLAANKLAVDGHLSCIFLPLVLVGQPLIPSAAMAVILRSFKASKRFSADSKSGLCRSIV